MATPSLLRLYEGVVQPDWLDYNDHMNIAYYVLTFDHATDALVDYVGMGHTYRQRSRCSTFVLETHLNFQRELVVGDPIHVVTQLLGFDSKRIHYFHRMYHSERGFLAATTELIMIHVDLARRQSVAMPLEIMNRLGEVMAQHILVPRPPQAGRVIGVRSKPVA